MKATPIVKWAGGKTRLLPRLLARVPLGFRRYYEPFIGGGALFFALEPGAATIADINPALVTLYQTIVSDLDGIIRVVLSHKAEHADERYYYDVRGRWNDSSWRAVATPAEIAGTFIYLNKTCFNGLWRENKSGGFNVPRGDYDDPTILYEDALRAARTVLTGAHITRGSFQDTTADASAGDFVYFDPPYDPLTKTSSFTTYAASPFGKAEQRALAEYARTLDARGVFVMLSNNDTPFIRDLYDGFLVETAPCGRSINSKAEGRGKIDEVIITSRRV
jgi:DNA adenine methylase